MTDDYNYPTIDDLIMWRTISGDIRCFTDKEKKNEISKDEIGTLPECSPVYVYEKAVWVNDPAGLYWMRIDNIINGGFLDSYSYFKDPAFKESLTAEDIANLLPATTIYSMYEKLENGWLIYYEGQEKPEYLTYITRVKLIDHVLFNEKYEVYTDEAMTNLYEIEPVYLDEDHNNLDMDISHYPELDYGMRFFVKEK